MKVKELMIPVEQYVTVGEDATLLDVFLALNTDLKAKNHIRQHAHRDVLVLDATGKLLGKVTMVDIFQALEPTYKRITNGRVHHEVLTGEYVASVFREFDLWSDSLDELCERGTESNVVDVMHLPQEVEYVNEDADLERAIHRYVMGVHQPLLVRDENGKVTGVLRFGDVFEEVRTRMLACGKE